MYYLSHPHKKNLTMKKAKLAEREEEQEDDPFSLFLKPVASKRPWYMGGKIALSKDDQNLHQLNRKPSSVNPIEIE